VAGQHAIRFRYLKLKACTGQQHGKGDDGDCWHGTIEIISEKHGATRDAKAKKCNFWANMSNFSM